MSGVEGLKPCPTCGALPCDQVSPPVPIEGGVRELVEALTVAAVELQLAGGWLREAGAYHGRVTATLDASNKVRAALSAIEGGGGRETLYEAAERLFHIQYPDRDWSALKADVQLSWASAAWDEGGGGALQPSASEQADGGVVARLAIAEAEVSRLTAENRDLRSLPWPRAYVLERASEWKRLLREVNGYLKTCRGSCGSDIEGRDHAIAASDALIAMLAATPPATPIAGGFGSRPQEAVVPTEPVADRWADLERLAKAAMAEAPAPWSVKPRERGPHGNLPSELIDANGEWVASFDGADEQAFSAAANPAAILELINAARHDEEAGQ